MNAIEWYVGDLKDDIVLTIDGSRISTQDYLFLSTSATNIEYVNYYMGVTLDTEAETTITPPDGLTTEKYTMSYKAARPTRPPRACSS